MAVAGAEEKSATVTVACKVVGGLRLRLFEMTEVQEPIPGGGFRTVPMARQLGGEVVLRGAPADFGKDIELIGGYGMTHNVSRDFWEQWLEQNKGAALVENKQVFAMANAGSVAAKAKEHASQISGFEPATEKDPRVKRTHPGVSTPEKDG